MDLPPPRSSASDQRIIQQNASNIGQTAVPTVKVMRLQSPNLVGYCLFFSIQIGFFG